MISQQYDVVKTEIHETILTSPAPRNKNLCSDRLPPTNLSAATTPARTTAAVPWNKETNGQGETKQSVQAVKAKGQAQKWPTVYLYVIIEDKMSPPIFFKQLESIVVCKIFKLHIPIQRD